MAVNKPRTRENYPTHRLKISGRIAPEAMDFVDDFHWQLRVTKSEMVYYAFLYSLCHKQDFINFCKEKRGAAK